MNLQVAGECVAILGELAGKTTLLKLLCGLETLQGRSCLRKPLQAPNDISLIFQNYGLFPWKTVRENILLPVQLRKKRSGMSEKLDENELGKLLDYLGLREFAHRFPAELSGGQLQRTALGRAVMSGASLLLMDEPFSALDLRNRIRLQSFMKTFLEDTGMTSVIVTHSIEEALCMGDRVAVFDPEREGSGQSGRTPARNDPDQLLLDERDRRNRRSLLQMQEAEVRGNLTRGRSRTTDN